MNGKPSGSLATAFTSSAPRDRAGVAPPSLPRWLSIVANIALAFHLFAVAILALSASSGPWPIDLGSSQATGPQFAVAISEFTTINYLQHLGLTHNYHFDSNRTKSHSVFLEVNLWDEHGELTKTLRFPDPRANPWVRARQRMLAQNIGEDQSFQPAQGEAIPAPGQKTNTVNFFYPPTRKSEVLELYQEEDSRVPKDRPVLFRPTDWSLVLARSYARYVQREHGAARVELIRHSRQPIMPELMVPLQPFPGKLLLDQPPPGALDELICNFGDGQPKRWRPNEDIDRPK